MWFMHIATADSSATSENVSDSEARFQAKYGGNTPAEEQKKTVRRTIARQICGPHALRRAMLADTAGNVSRAHGNSPCRHATDSGGFNDPYGFVGRRARRVFRQG